MPFEQRDSGLITPQQQPKEEPPRGPLELPEGERRDEVAKLLQDLHCKLNHRGGITLPHHGSAEISKSRIRLLEALAVELLGEGVEFWEYT